MWFEVLPVVAIMGSLMATPAISFYCIHKYFFDSAYTRQVDGPADFMMYYLRDERLTGKGWKCRTLREAEELDE